MLFSLLLILLSIIQSHAQTNQLTSTESTPGSSIAFYGGDLPPTGPQATYASYTAISTISRGSTSGSVQSPSSPIAANGSFVSPTSSSTSLDRAPSTLVLQGTASVANSSSNSSNIQPCNNYPEFCNRNYSNITFIAAHNSPFVNPNNVAANQEYGVIEQLNDGIRMLQGQTHFVNNTVFYCHTSCNLLNAGTAESYFANITKWLNENENRRNVVTLLIGNSDFRPVTDYVMPLEASGLSELAYKPTKIPMALSDWPTLSDMIILNNRVVIFMDYNANQTEVPYILDEFAQLWETPFSPTNDNFPCTEQRPPGLSQADAEHRMYMANHNLNTEITALGLSLLVPSRAILNHTNGLNGSGSLGAMADDCEADWGRPPNFLLVDYYNRGSYPGSVFEVAARHNNVTYNRSCCGEDSNISASVRYGPNVMLFVATSIAGAILLVWI